MRSVPAAMDNVVPFRRPAGRAWSEPAARGGAAWGSGALGRARGEQRSLMDAVYATGTLCVAAGDRDSKLVASRLQVYGFLAIDEVGADGSLRRLRPSEAIRARAERPWRLSRTSYGVGPAVTIPTADSFLFETPDRPA